MLAGGAARLELDQPLVDEVPGSARPLINSFPMRSQLAAVSAIKILLIGRRGKQSKAGMDCVKTALRMNLQRAVALYFPSTWVKTGLVLSL
jgi:hypothetical protein